jgi:hypothetical protein
MDESPSGIGCVALIKPQQRPRRECNQTGGQSTSILRASPEKSAGSFGAPPWHRRLILARSQSQSQTSTKHPNLSTNIIMRGQMSSPICMKDIGWPWHRPPAPRLRFRQKASQHLQTQPCAGYPGLRCWENFRRLVRFQPVKVAKKTHPRRGR